MSKVITLEEVLDLAKQLSLADKVDLIVQVSPEIKRELNLVTPRKSLRGLWRGANITDKDIKEVRQEICANFPREIV
jgi:hypothetical protein